MLPVSDSFISVPRYGKQSPVSFPIPHYFLFPESAAQSFPAKVLHLCRNKCTCWLETVILHQFRLEGWLVMHPRDSNHHNLGTLHTAWFEPSLWSSRDRRAAWVTLSDMIYLLQQIDSEPLFSNMSLNSLHWNTVFPCDCDSWIFFFFHIAWWWKNMSK